MNTTIGLLGTGQCSYTTCACIDCYWLEGQVWLLCTVYHWRQFLVSVALFYVSLEWSVLDMAGECVWSLVICFMVSLWSASVTDSSLTDGLVGPCDDPGRQWGSVREETFHSCIFTNWTSYTSLLYFGDGCSSGLPLNTGWFLPYYIMKILLKQTVSVHFDSPDWA